MNCRACGSVLQPVHGHGACLNSGCPMFGQNQDECCRGEQAQETRMIYEYVCPNGHRTEKTRKVAERDDPVACPVCGSPTQRAVGSGHFSLKGGGWYKDGYSKPG